MDPITIILLLTVSFCFVVYMLDRKGWHATLKRVSTIIRANIESGKPVKQLEHKIETKAKEDWDAQFTGKPVESEKQHEIVRTYYARVGGSIHPHWKCKCGYSDWHLRIDLADAKAKEHVWDQNKGDEMLKLNGGTHAW